MTTSKAFAAALGFAFVAAWIGWNVGYALLCLLGAGVFYLIAGLLEGEIDLGELQTRISQRQPSPTPPATTRPRARVH